MSEQFLIEQLNEAIDAIVAPASSGTITFTAEEPVLRELAALASELRLLPREGFKSSLKETLRRSATMTATGTEKQQASETSLAGYHTVTPYLTVKRAEQLVEFVKQAFGATEVFRTIGSAGGLHAEVTIGESKLMIGGYEAVEEIPTTLHREAGVKDPTGNIWWIATHKLGLPGTYIPEGLRPVTPFLHPIGAPGLIEFMKQAFAAEEISREQSPEGMIHHAVVRIGDSMIEMGEAHGDAQPMPPGLFVNVENLEEVYTRALNAGATSLQAPITQGYGRTAWVKDAWDNT